MVVLLLVLVAGAVLAVVLYLGDDDGGTTTTTETEEMDGDDSGREFVEAGTGFNLEDIRGGKFASLTLKTSAGLESYLVAGDTREYAGLVSALLGAETQELQEGDSGKEASEEASEGASEGASSRSTLTFVMDDRTTITFGVDDGSMMLTRAGVGYKTWEDLAVVLEEAVGHSLPDWKEGRRE